ncbi:helix-hairpin-helix domain-containing protein [Sphingomonas sp. PAMC 26617]|uniref:helix-hairpin-helix domain-containing protein n=1 Tax=Sphingomonas sp. PAMC 26617 TaxID=1112216 RepID=UPI00028A33AF|nr:helix-hairpin-helix domain-containing protein [Sphingomonas sp. PAMC 26617]
MAASPENPNQAIDFMLPITTVHVALMVVLAIAAVATIIWGSMLARRRKNAEKQVEKNFEVAEAHGATHEPSVSADGTQVATMSADVPERPAQDTDRQVPVAPRIPEDRPVSGAAPATATPEPAPAPAPAPAAAPPAAPAPAASTLTQIKGLGPKLAATLAEQGITRVEQIAALTPSDAETLDAKLGAFRGRMTRDRWIEQARLLSAGDRAGYEAQFGKLGG